MLFSLLLHLYQPPTQDLRTTKRITEESYKPILSILEKTQCKVNINLCASLTLQLKKLGEEETLARLRSLARKNCIEFTDSAAFHPILPRLSVYEIRKQIYLNREINEKIIGNEFYRPKGFFPPEMAVSKRLLKVLIDTKIEWIVIDEYSYPKGVKKIPHNVFFYFNNERLNLSKNNETKVNKININISNTENLPNKNLKIFFRNEKISTKIAYSDIESLEEFDLEYKKYDEQSNNYLLMAMDGETFGHHQKSQINFLFDLLSNKKEHFVYVSEIEKYIRTKMPLVPLPSSWAVTDELMRKKIYWPKWSSPKNKIHAMQWRLTRLAFKNFPKDELIQNLLHQALHSDQYWWASKTPYWHPGMIKKGAWMLIEVIRRNKLNNVILKQEGEKIYEEIVEIVGGQEERVEFLHW